MMSNVRQQYDALLALQPPGSAPISASGISSQVNIYEITGSPYGVLNGENGIGSFDLVMYIGAADFSSGNETYSVALQTVNEAGQATTAETFVISPAQVNKVLSFPLQPSTLADFAGDAAAVQLDVTLGGTTPSFQYWAFLAPQSRA